MISRNVLQVIFWAIGVPLQLLVIAGLLQGAWRRFTLIFVYSIISFLATVVEIAAKTSPLLDKKFQLYYWINEAILQILVFLIVISLIYQATEHLKNRAIIARYLIAGALVIAVGSLLVHYQNVPNHRMTLVVRDLSFFSAILDLGLWSTLIAGRRKDRVLLMLSGGLGMQFSGEALGQSIRDVAMHNMALHNPRWRPVSLVGTCLVVLSNMLCLYVWWQAFRQYNAADDRSTSTQIRAASKSK